MTVEMAARIFAQLAQADDVRLTLAGVGDPLLHPRVFEMIQTASSGGIKAIHVETDLLGVGDEQMKQLAASPVDVLSVQIPAVTQTMYRRMMDCDELARLIDNMRVFLGYRSERATPILVPTFVKCRENLGEMEAWYDHWIRNLGCAVIAGPSDCSGQIPDVAAVDMSPPLRVPCRRLASRMMILSSGQVVACENDVHGRYALGQIGVETVSEIWRKGFSSLRAEHAAGRYSLPICQSCRDWHRP
jgi:spiro-SPASM protein